METPISPLVAQQRCLDLR